MIPLVPAVNANCSELMNRTEDGIEGIGMAGLEVPGPHDLVRYLAHDGDAGR